MCRELEHLVVSSFVGADHSEKEKEMRTGAFVFGITVAASMISSSVRAQSLDGPYRGMYVCEKMKRSPDILRAPIDLVVSGTSVRFGRPLFNWNGTRVTGTELATGTIDNGGKVHAASAWFARGFAFQGAYDGTVNASGGTLTGTQSWRGPDGDSGSRTCTAAIVAAPRADRPVAQQQ
jgi:hypothetical protein